MKNKIVYQYVLKTLKSIFKNSDCKIYEHAIGSNKCYSGFNVFVHNDTSLCIPINIVNDHVYSLRKFKLCINLPTFKEDLKNNIYKFYENEFKKRSKASLASLLNVD